MSETFPAVDLGDIAAGIGGFVILGEDVRDVAGASVASAGDVNGDGFDDIIIGATFADAAGNAKTTAGAAYVVFGKASGFGAEIDLAQVAQGEGGFVIQGENAYDALGASAAGGDLNGDGFDDLIVGASNADAAGNAKSYAGAVYVVYGRAGGFPASINLVQVAQGQGGFVIQGEDSGDQAGRAVDTAGDVNGDGFQDLIIGAPDADSAENAKSRAGAAYVVFGQASGFGATIDLAQVSQGQGGFVIQGEDAGDYAGASVASAGDLNGDGIDDLIVGAPGADGGGNAKTRAGSAYVVFGKTGGFGASIDLANVADGEGGFVIQGQRSIDSAGNSVASAGDVNGDGFDDLIIGATSADAAASTKRNAGAAFVVFGKAGGLGGTIDLGKIAKGEGGFVLRGEASYDNAGQSVASAGDFNGDGFGDLIIGANGADGPGNTRGGVAYVVFGKAGGFDPSIELAQVAAGQGGFVIEAEDADDAIGLSVASAGDVNGDGFDDLIVDAQNADGAGNAKSESGGAYVIFGRAFGTGEPSNGADTLSGGTGADTIEGLGGSDRLAGNDGEDVLRGGNGRDTLLGGNGNDTLAGGKGRDVLDGGAGADLFRFAVPGDGPDTILSFTSADEIQFATAGFGDLPLGGIKANRFEADADASASSVAVRFTYQTTTGKLFFDGDGSGAGAAILIALFDGAPTLAASDIAII